MNRYLGASGRNGSTATRTTEKKAGRQSRTFHSSSRPRISLGKTTENETFGPVTHTHTHRNNQLSCPVHLSPKNWPDSFPIDVKVAEVNVTRPLSFRGEISPRYIRCVLCPKPAGHRRKNQPVSQSERVCTVTGLHDWQAN